MILMDSGWENHGIIKNDPQKVVQKLSRFNRNHGPTEKSLKESDSSWFETLGIVKLLFLGPLWIIKILVQRSKNVSQEDPPKNARRAPLKQIEGECFAPKMSEGPPWQIEAECFAPSRKIIGSPSQHPMMIVGDTRKIYFS